MAASIATPRRRERSPPRRGVILRAVAGSTSVLQATFAEEPQAHGSASVGRGGSCDCAQDDTLVVRCGDHVAQVPEIGDVTRPEIG